MSKPVSDHRSPGPSWAEHEVIERIEAFRRRRPRLRDEIVTLAHGAGGKASAALVDAVFVEAFRNPLLESLGDGAVIELPGGQRIAVSTDSFVVQPLRFPGGSIGDLAVHGTANDLAMAGALPSWITAAFVLEEGFPIAQLEEIVADMAAAAAAAGVQIVTGDTKVVPRGAADGLFITTTGVGLIPAGREFSAAAVRPGDKVLISGSMGDHGMAVMLARGDLAIDADIRSDTASVSELVEVLLVQPRPPGGYVTPLAVVSAPCATSWPGPPTSEWFSTRNAWWCGHRWVVPAKCWASTRFTSPTRVSSLRSWHPRKLTRHWSPCGDTRWVPKRPKSARSLPSLRQLSCCARCSAEAGSLTCSSVTRCRGSVEKRPMKNGE